VVLDELLRYQDFGIDPVIVVMADRPAPEVSALIESLPRRMVVRVCPPNPIVTSSGLAFRQAKIAHYRVLKGLGRPIDWVLLQDDDRWFEPLGITEELPKALEQPVDLLYARSAFLWDDSEHVNVARYHVSPTLFRFDPDSDFPDDQDSTTERSSHDVRQSLRLLLLMRGVSKQLNEIASLIRLSRPAKTTTMFGRLKTRLRSFLSRK